MIVTYRLQFEDKTPDLRVEISDTLDTAAAEQLLAKRVYHHLLDGMHSCDFSVVADLRTGSVTVFRGGSSGGVYALHPVQIVRLQDEKVSE